MTVCQIVCSIMWIGVTQPISALYHLPSQLGILQSHGSNCQSDHNSNHDHNCYHDYRAIADMMIIVVIMHSDTGETDKIVILIIILIMIIIVVMIIELLLIC